jgi:predicted ATPase/class 3 adenylate cyclase
MPDLPSGTLTFLFSDVEGSTQLLERHGAAMGAALARHHVLFEAIVARHDGAIFETVGDAVYAAFARPGDAVAAALEAQRALAAEDWGAIGRLAVRIALHTGQVERRGDHYFGPALFRCARLQALGYGEQTLLSGVTARIVADALPDGASLRDLGTHRLKDLGEPEHVYQLIHRDLRADFPALKSLDAHPHNLPVQLSSFIGRDAELAQLSGLLAQQRLVTLLGPGGIGKTRLALQAAAQQIEGFADGVWFVDLSAMRDPELVPGAIAASLGLHEQPGHSIRVTLAEHLHSKRLLLVLDNLEQLLPAAASSIAELLAAAPELQLIVTSRAPLRVRGEREFPVPPLAAGASDRLEAEPPAAVALFVDRARAIKPNLEVTSETGPLIAVICERLDGLPLAIELGAARLRLFTIAQLHERLTERLPLLTGGARDLPERQQTLRTAIAWSEELLNEPERQIFARLGVFVGGFSLEAAEAVAGPDLGGDVLELLTALIEQSLVRMVDGPTGQPRYSMLETIREYAVERGEGLGGVEEAYRRHAEYFVEVAERESPHLRHAGGQEVLERLDADYPNSRAALELAIQRRDAQLALRLVGGLWRVWAETYRWREGLALTERALAVPAPPLSAALAEAVHAAGILCGLLGMWEEDKRYTEQSLLLHRQLGDLRGVARALNNLAPNEPAAGIAMLEESLAIQRGLGGDGDASTLINLAIAEIARDDLQAAEKWATEGLGVARAEVNAYLTGFALIFLGDLRLWQGYANEAKAFYGEAEDVLRGDPGMTASALTGSLFVAVDLGDQRRGRELLSQALTLMRAAEWREHVAPEVLDAAAQIALTADPLVGATLWGASDAVRERQQQPRYPVDVRYFIERVRAAGAATTDTDFAASYQRGRRLSTDEALAIAETLARADDA